MGVLFTNKQMRRSCLRWLGIVACLAIRPCHAQEAGAQEVGAEEVATEEAYAWQSSIPSTPATLRYPLQSPSTEWTDSGVSITDPEAWRAIRSDWIAAWKGFLGPMPEERSPPTIQIESTERTEGIVRQKIRLEVEPQVFMDAVLLKPDRDAIPQRSLPAIVALHPTTEQHLDEISGRAGDGPRAIGLHFARRGYVVLCPKNFLWQDAKEFQTAVALHAERHPHSLGMAKMLFDAQRAVDLLVGMPEVDLQRIGAIGHSLGAKEVLYLMAFDDRVSAGIASEGGLDFSSTNWDAAWYLGSRLSGATTRFQHAQLLALIAPRPFLVMGGETGPGAADGSQSLPVLSAALPIWRLFPMPHALGFWNHGQGHVFAQPQLDRAIHWFDHHLSLP